MMEDVVSRLLKGYSPATPVAVVYKASWPEELILRGTLETITEQVKDADYENCLDYCRRCSRKRIRALKLYAADYSHAYRQAKP